MPSTGENFKPFKVLVGTPQQYTRYDASERQQPTPLWLSDDMASEDEFLTRRMS